MSQTFNVNFGRYQHLVEKYYASRLQMKKDGIDN